VLFDSLDSPNTGVSFGFNFDATFATGASTFHATDIALLLDQPVPAGFLPDDDDFTVSLHGGIPLADVSFDPMLGLSVFPSQGPVLGSVTLPMSDLSTSLTVEHFNQFASIPLQRNSLYWIDLTATSASIEDAQMNWGFTSDVSGVGVAQNYNSSNLTDFDFFRNQGVPPFASDFAFQMKVSVPEPSTWVLMLAGFGGLGLLVYRRRAALGSSRA
jgi:PEP-CTERM motif-containing protein